MIKQSEDFTTASAMRGGEGCARIFRAPLPEKAAPLAMASRIELPALPGDIFVTRKGMSHGLRNNGGEPLIFFAVVAE